mgnify:CR=1 FL=1
MKYIQNFSKYFLIFLTFIFASRYVQRIIFDGDLQNSYPIRLALGRDSCKPKINSILDYANSENEKIIFLIIDAYPDTKVFNNLLNKKSKLHEYLKNNSQFIEGKTPIDYTYRSLPFLLGKIYPTSQNCRFPFFKGEIKPNMILSSDLTGAHDSLCFESFPSTNSFIRYTNKLKTFKKP